MQTIEITAKSLDEARTQAAAKLGVEPNAVTITILEESKGLFGKKSIRVKAEAGSAAAPAAETKKPARKTASKSEPAPEPVEAAPVEEAPAAAKEEPKEKPARRGRSAKSEPKSETPAAAATESAAAPSADEPVATQEDANTLLSFAQKVIDGSGLTAEVTLVGTQGKYVNMTIDGKDTSYLVGKHGEVLNHVQYLLNVISAQQLHNGVRVVLDGNDYRRKREEQLASLANKIASEVARRGEEAVLDALPAFERRIIHKTLSENDAVQTYSEGEEPNRRVVVAPVE